MSFKQPQLWDALQHPRDISSDTVAEMETLADKCPYFQLLYTLIAKAKHDQQTPDAYESLGKAAAYAPDRRLLRQIFYDDLVLTLPDSSETGLPVIESPPVIATKEEPDLDLTSDETASEEGDAAPEIEDTPTEPTDTTTDGIVEEETEEAVDTEEDDSLREELTQTLPVLQDSKEELPDSIEATNTNDSPADITETEEGSPLLDQLEGISDEPTPRNPNQSMQQDIIDRFVKANPSITRDSSLEPSSTDLSTESTELPDDMVTENLAEIMLKQGKVGKAVDLYQKLMLKFPEKKTYFAQKIDQLTNN